MAPPLSSPRRIRLTIREYYQQYVLPKRVSAHRLWIDNYEVEASTVAPASEYVPVLYYKIAFTDLSSAVVHKNHGCDVEILPGTVTNR